MVLTRESHLDMVKIDHHTRNAVFVSNTSKVITQTDRHTQRQTHRYTHRQYENITSTAYAEGNKSDLCLDTYGNIRF